MRTSFRCVLSAFLPGLLIFLSVAGCGTDVAGPKKGLDPLVGVWRAQSLVMTHKSSPGISVDLVDQGATFTLSILSTGQYSASLAAFGQSNTEVGTVTVSGNQVTITPTSPAGPPLVATYRFQGDLLILDGDSEFDFNLDGTPEDAFAHIELLPLDL
jgi:hypothetical protein